MKQRGFQQDWMTSTYCKSLQKVKLISRGRYDENRQSFVCICAKRTVLLMTFLGKMKI